MLSSSSSQSKLILSSRILSFQALVLTLFVCVISNSTWAQEENVSSSNKAQLTSKNAGTQSSENANLEQDTALNTREPSLIEDPMKMSFRISRLERGITPDSRHFIAPRVVTLSAIGPISHLDESLWRGKKLAVFHPSSVNRHSNSSTADSSLFEKVGEIEIRSVYQATMQAVVVLDDVARGLMARGDQIGVVMLGDVARLESPIKAPVKPKVRRYSKPKERSPYERDDMRWRF